MELVVTEEQAELRAELRRFFAAKSPIAEVRRLMISGDGHDPAVWRQMGEQLGLQGLAVPEEYGGAGFGLSEQTIAMEEMGRALLCAPYLGSAVLAANALLHAGDEAARRELLPGIASGETIAALALTEEGGRWDLDAVAMTARPDGHGGMLLDGVKTYVLDGRVADLLLVVARTPGGLGLFAVTPPEPAAEERSEALPAATSAAAGGRLVRTPLPTLDQTRRLARLEFSGVPARLVSGEASAAPGLAVALDRAVVALAAEQVGGAAQVLEMSVEYAKLRHQFGRPIGSFQAIKHKCADMLLEVESARSAAMYAAFVADQEPESLGTAAGLAKVYCSEAFLRAAGETIQIHGGIGFTWEHDAHLYYKRAKSSQLFLGAPSEHRERLAGHVGL